MLRLILFLLTIGVSRMDALEEPSPEVFLEPRHFNPHPYELARLGADGRRQNARLRELANHIDAIEEDRNRGPVLFPASIQPVGGGNPDPYILQRLRDTHPYAGVLAKKKLKYEYDEERDNDDAKRPSPQILRALAAHGAKVLGVQLAKNSPNIKLDYDDETKKDYAFAYKVEDDFTGDGDFSHSESQNSQATNGEYRVRLPDGRLQIVSYTADEGGYKADVRYSERRDPFGFAAATAAAGPFLGVPHLPIPPPHLPIPPPHLPIPRPQLAQIPIYADSLLALKSPARDLLNQQLISKEQVRLTRPSPDAGSRDDLNGLLVLADKYRAKHAPAAQIHEDKLGPVGEFIAGTLAPYTLSTLANRLRELGSAVAKFQLPTAATLLHRADRE